MIPRPGIVLVLLCALILVQNSVDARREFEVEANILAVGHAQFAGNASLHAVSTGMVLDARGAPEDLSVRIHFDAARIRVVNLPYAVLVSRSGPGSQTTAAPPETLFNDTRGASIWLQDAAVGNSSYRVLPAKGGGFLDLSMAGDGSLDVAPRQDWTLIREGGFWAERPLDPIGPAGALRRTASQASVLSGEAYAFLYGGTFVYEPQNGPARPISTGEHLNASRSVLADPTGQFGSWWYDRIVLIIDNGVLEAQVGGSADGNIRFAVTDLSGRIEGDFAVAGVTGSVKVDGNDLPPKPQLFQAVGDFQTSADFSSGEAAVWEVSGPATFVGIDGETIVGVRPRPDSTTAVAVAGLGVALAVYIAVSWVRRGVVFVGLRFLEVQFFTFAPLAARLDVTKVLEHPVRQGIMTMLAGHHAMRNLADLRRDVAAAYGISSWTAYFHLRTLWRANHLTVVRMRGHHYIGPNSGSMGSREQRVAASLLHHPVGLAIAEFVTAHPAIAQKDIVAHVQAKLLAQGKSMSYAGILKWIRKFETTKITPTHLVRAFGASLNPAVDPRDVHDVAVSLIVRETDPNDARVLRYRPTDVLYDVVRTFVGRRDDLGSALIDLTRMRVMRRERTAPS